MGEPEYTFAELDAELKRRFRECIAERDALASEVARLETQARGYRAVLRSAAVWLSFNARGSNGTLLHIQINDALGGKYLEVPTKEGEEGKESER